MSSDIHIITGDVILLDRVEPLWLQQRDFHANVNTTWRDSMKDKTFAARRTELLRTARSADDFRVTIAHDESTREDVGYCLTIIVPNGGGVIESLFVVEQRRGQRIGERLLDDAVDWLRKQNTTRITLTVMIGNDDALRFYERFGFRARTTEMELPPRLPIAHKTLKNA
ncbi:MAG: GNAT family N-acetyltransferase [Tepidisphaeraceae bacterium]